MAGMAGVTMTDRRKFLTWCGGLLPLLRQVFTLFAMRLAVIDPLPMYRQGVVTVLADAGHVVETPDDLLAWSHRERDGLVLLTLDAGASWQLLERLHSAVEGCAVIALLADESAGAGARAVRAGARSVLPRGVGAAMLARTVQATAEGQSVLPASALAALLSGASLDDSGANVLTDEQRVWLRNLADGMTVARLADRVGYSERAMFRLLQSLYRRLGARTRIQAIVRAQELGWLPRDDDDRKVN